MGVKQVIVVNKMLNMRKGKIASQVAHASMMFLVREFGAGKQHATIAGQDYAEVPFDITPKQWEWLNGNWRKIVAYVESHEELCDLQDKAAEAGIDIYPIIDEGLTEFHGQPTLTCCAFGPDEDEKLDAITGHLKLL